MNFVQEHAAWLVAKGVEVMPPGEMTESQRRSFGRTTPLPIDPLLPFELQVWHLEALYDRCDMPIFELGIGDGWFSFERPSAERHPMLEYMTEDAGPNFPIRPAVLADAIHYGVLVETLGPRTGWVFSVEWMSGVDSDQTGPIATSLSQLLELNRGLTELGVRAEWSLPGEKPKPGFGPPLDTPSFALGIPGLLVDDDFDGTPIAPSISTLFPLFKNVATMPMGGWS